MFLAPIVKGQGHIIAASKLPSSSAFSFNTIPTNDNFNDSCMFNDNLLALKNCQHWVYLFCFTFLNGYLISNSHNISSCFSRYPVAIYNIANRFNN